MFILHSMILIKHYPKDLQNKVVSRKDMQMQFIIYIFILIYEYNIFTHKIVIF